MFITSGGTAWAYYIQRIWICDLSAHLSKMTRFLLDRPQLRSLSRRFWNTGKRDFCNMRFLSHGYVELLVSFRQVNTFLSQIIWNGKLWNITICDKTYLHFNKTTSSVKFHWFLPINGLSNDHQVSVNAVLSSQVVVLNRTCRQELFEVTSPSRVHCHCAACHATNWSLRNCRPTSAKSITLTSQKAKNTRCD